LALTELSSRVSEDRLEAVMQGLLILVGPRANKN